MRVFYPDRIVNRHVGGNTTYALAIREGLRARGITTGAMPSGPHPSLTLLAETAYGLTSRPGDVLHYSADTGPLIKTKAASVVTVHGVASRWIDVARTPRQEKVWRYRVQRAIDSTDALITVSQSAADDVSEVFGVDRSSIRVIPHGMDVEGFQAPTALSAELRVRLPGAFALYLGNIEPRKNLIELVRAFQRPEIRSLGIPLVLAGKPAWNFAEAMETIARADNVIHAGFVSNEDRIALMQACTVFAFPSLYEGFGLPVLEAMAAGAPVVSSRRGSLAEVAGPSRIFEALDAEGLGAELERAITDEVWQREARSTGPTWARNFSWDRSIEAHIEVYEKALSA
ncbi:glycosyltransferase family 4 protein [Pseudoclavibacter helvolus]|uniref:glycosyltransferase family 4 protein n=1 Tax=Pseudoclavibacter helvolus TaxID=255205 RepID=UPI0024AE3061|nr:glycosyltransferase family 1 protein [Pseudoclavibacter helvolus]